MKVFAAFWNAPDSDGKRPLNALSELKRLEMAAHFFEKEVDLKVVFSTADHIPGRTANDRLCALITASDAYSDCRTELRNRPGCEAS